MPIEIFFSYAHEDETLIDALRSQLVVFERQGRIVKWHDRQIPTGSDWESVIDERLRQCKIILLCVSPAFLASQYCWEVELRIAMDRHARGEARVIPIILRPCAWNEAPFARLQALPKDARPVSQWSDRDEVCLQLARSIMTVVDELAVHSSPAKSQTAPWPRGHKVTRQLMPGDHFPRLLAPWSPPTATNLPKGYRPRLNQLAQRAARESLLRESNGAWMYPAEFIGPGRQVDAFVASLTQSGELKDRQSWHLSGEVAIGFDYMGRSSPEELRDTAIQHGLRVVHCGVTLVLTMARNSIDKL
jgi:hypothetical protein